MKTLLIKGGRVVDPKQNLDRITNVFVCDGKIAEITDEMPAADFVIDASGKIVSPGFIDIHMHEDDYDSKNDAILTSMSTSALHMGVTLDIGGNCGDNSMDPSRFLDITDRDGAPVNIGMLVGHTWLRNSGGKADKYSPISSDTLKTMINSCEEHLANGALGISFGVKYVPGTTDDEILGLSRLCRKGSKIVSSHVRADVDGVFDAADELARTGRQAGVRVQFSHIGSMGGYGQMNRLLEKINGYRESGIDMLCDCYPYSAFSTGIGETTYDDGFLERYRAGYDSILIVSGKYAGKRCTKEIFDELRAEAPETATVGYFMKPEDVKTALLSPLVMIGSDGVRTDGMGHPRASGAFARFISDYMATGLISVPDGIRKMSTMAAERLNLPHKGNLMTGSDADITIFDINRVKDMATYENGQIPPIGFDYVLIGGEIALENDKVVNGRLGRAVRR